MEKRLGKPYAHEICKIPNPRLVTLLPRPLHMLVVYIVIMHEEDLARQTELTPCLTRLGDFENTKDVAGCISIILQVRAGALFVGVDYHFGPVLGGGVA